MTVAIVAETQDERDKAVGLIQAPDDAPVSPKTCPACGGTGLMPIGFYSLEWDGNEELGEECRNCAGPTD